MNPLLDTPRFFFSDISRFTGTAQNTLQGWIARKAFELSEFDRDAEGKGNRRLVTLRTVYAFALTTHLVEHGFSPSYAFANVKQFTNSQSPQDDRNKDTLRYDEGRTYLIIYTSMLAPKDSDGSTTYDSLPVHIRVDCIKDKRDLADCLFPETVGDRVHSVSTAVDCDWILNRVDDMIRAR